MIIALPVSRSDISIFPALVNSMVKFGGFESHRIIVLPTPSAASDATESSKALQSICRQFDIATLNIEPEGGWPQACNQHFAAALEKMHELRIDEPFLWVEADCCFIQYNPVNAILTEYHMAKRPFLGHKRPTKEVMVGADGEHMVACGVYPADFYTRTRLWQFIRNDQPFDVWLRWEIAPHCHDTKLIQHCPRSVDYHEILDPPARINGLPQDKGNLTPFTVSREAVMVHGCKDGSLSKLVCGEKSAHEDLAFDMVEKLSDFTEKKAESFYPQDTLPTVTTEDEEDLHFKAIWDAIQYWRIQVPSVNSSAVEARPGHAKLILDKVKAVVIPPSKEDKGLHDALLELLGTYDDKEAIISTAADELKVSPDAIIKLAKEPKGLFKLTGLGDFMVKLTPKGVKMAAKT